MNNAYYLFNKDYFNFGKSIEDVRINEIDKNSVNEILLDMKFSDFELYLEIPGALSFKTKTVYPGLLIGIGNPHDAAKQDEAFKLGFNLDYVTGLPIIPGSTVKGVLKHNLENYYGWDEEELCVVFGSKNTKGTAVFLDAIPVQGGENDKIFADDYITPHGDNPLKNPTPLKMLKVRSGVTYEFRFLNITDKQKKLFEEVITTLGIGAKTNVGYGVMEKA
ncbi:type III-B CRISPR module RAMP protein Cmr6 [Lactovum odontotermitis]